MAIQFRLLLMMLFIMGIAFPVLAQEPEALTGAGYTRTEVQMRGGPGLLYPATEVLAPDTTVYITGRDAAMLWLYVEVSADNRTGWLPAGSVQTDGELFLPELPVVETAASPSPVPDLPEDEEGLAIAERLLQTPILLNLTTDVVYETFATGQERGQRANVFTRIGDSHVASGGFLTAMGYEGLCQTGPYTYLEETIEYFRETSLSDNSNSFTAFSYGATTGVSSVSILDPLWSDKSVCGPDEDMMVCEYRLKRPGVAFVIIGGVDITHVDDLTIYRENLSAMVETTMDMGIIPILSTLPALPDNFRWRRFFDYNAIILDIAEAYKVPLINIWRATSGMDRYGIGPDNVHLRYQVGQFCNFTGIEHELGGTLHNLLALQTLDILRREVLTADNLIENPE